MKRIIVACFGLLGATQLLSSCAEDYLDEDPKSLYTPQTVLVDSLGFEAAMAGLQSVVREQYTRSDEQGLLSVMQVGTDVAIPGQVQGVEVPYYNYTQLTSQDQGANVFWNQAYRMINNANQIIAGAATAPATLRQGYKDRISAEARFYRAYAYNFLATLWGDVPLITEPVTTARTDFARAPIAEVNELIINDLKTAIPSLLPASRVISGRIAKGAAQHLLGEVYLRTNQNALAEQVLKEVIDGGQYKLITARYGVKSNQPGDYFSDMFIIGNQRRNQGNTELIWGIEQQLLVPGATTSAQQRRVWVPAYYNVKGMALADSLGGRGLGRLRLSNWVDYRLYPKDESADMRNSKYNLKRRFYYNDPSQTATYGKRVTGLTGSDTIFYITPYTTKWNQFDPTDTFGFGTIKDITMMRLGETYLLLAEAQFRQGKLADAAASINVLRTRAKAAQVTASDITLNFILDERARELIGEEQRRITLVRTGTLVERTLRLNGASVTGLTANNLLLPIPQSEIDRNINGTLRQNTGY
ncbi:MULTISPECIES: RagB/SusD family nutrient uptake outer membrane protein [Hymenobacter]|uniref:RagB/SusD family nutrient uptake outer membrane protein n=2 Tax=Hymenobacter TaxID=89966 RepID=A0ABS6WZ87_9BACT|nr:MULTISPECIES: RagB/SusD family nutrient uptake outer membrane protein [Hymenobacter]MBO3270226.1 RagB/SusD family nutrient uptake outer membrane protein [Hymenobacter defluvii]MBW3128828.1 RagB/SusD family nutrient uptake outer membrane protein [Hymenobacter profundi]